ncbi:hypothetical protein [Cohnella boryungensis]|uniref:VCBS repeat-containing protein n=1 Tax=Cohnella boryungensis TaxID=768479 RepID=A0ABV8SE17_9BACL
MPRRRLWGMIGGTALLLTAIVLAATPKDRFQSEPEPAVESASRQMVKQIPVAEKDIDIDGDGRMEKLTLVLTEGELRNEREPGPFQGEYYVGSFDAVLADAEGAEMQRMDLTPSFSELMQFRKGSFELIVNDYNRDGHPEFTLGQYGSSNNFIYNLYAIKPGGFEIAAKSLLVAASEYSIPLNKMSTGAFQYQYYDNSKGSWIEVTYAWDGMAYRKAMEKAAEHVIGSEEEEEASTRLTFIPASYGFDLAFNADYHVNADEIITVDGKAVVPFTSVLSMDDKTEKIRRQLEFIEPETRRSVLHTKLTDAVTTNGYGSSSELKSYGMLDGSRLVYANAAEQNGRLLSRYETLDLNTGVQKTLVSGGVDKLGEQDFYARNWLSPSGNKLVLNQYRTGLLEVLDLKEGTVRAFQGKYAHSWPVFMTVPSPDGTLFWYEDIEKREFRLIDLDEKRIASVAYPDGLFDYPAWAWSEDSRYTAFHYTFDKSRKHVISLEETEDIAPQGIKVYSREGRQVASLKSDSDRDEYVEIAAWLPDGRTILLRYFHLDREAGRKESLPMLDVGYRIYDLVSGTFTSLDTVEDLEGMRSSDLIVATNAKGQGFLLDRKSQRVWEGKRNSSIEEVALLSPAGDPVILRHDTEKAGAEIWRFDRASNEWESGSLAVSLREAAFVAEHWLVSEGTRYVDLRTVFSESR